MFRHQRRRAPIEAYAPRPSDADYVFFTAWPWAKHGDVNPPRIRFIEACRRAPGLTFEGGFVPRRRNDVPEVLPYTATARTSLPEYLAKVGRSAVAFNNPAVHGCLGWKLGEYLAMGKAIVSLPLDRVLPAPLEHGVHLHVVDGSPEALDEAISRLRTDHAYRVTLERNARQWYDEHLAPHRLAARALTHLSERVTRSSARVAPSSNGGSARAWVSRWGRSVRRGCVRPGRRGRPSRSLAASAKPGDPHTNTVASAVISGATSSGASRPAGRAEPGGAARV